MTNPKEHILAACAALFVPQQVTELTALGYRQRHYARNASGWFNNLEAMVMNALKFDSMKPEGVYVILNQLHTGCVARSDNKMLELDGKDKQRTSDKDILRRHWFVVDLDPVRPKGISSSAEEFEAAQRLMVLMQAYLEKDRSWPSGLTACSGNGFHLLYRIDLPNDADAKELCSDALHALANQFDNSVVEVDTSTFNAARLWKLYGTVARKGVDMPDRPHRRAEILTAPIPRFAEIGIVGQDQLVALASLASGRRATAATSTPRPRSRGGSSSVQRPSTEPVVDLDAFIQRHGISVKRVEPWDGGIRHILTACLFDPSHVGSSAMLGRKSTGEIFYTCQHNSCAGRRWADVVQLFEGRGKATAEGSRKNTASQARGDREEKVSGDPYDIAYDIIEEDFLDLDLNECHIRHHRGSFYVYDSERRAYRSLPDEELDVLVTRKLYGRVEKVTRTRVRDVIGCIRAQVSILGSDELDPPFMTHMNDGLLECVMDRNYLVSMKNGILDVALLAAGETANRCLRAHTSDWFTLVSLPFDFPENEAQWECPNWEAFLAEIFEGDEARVNILQEAMGYCYCLDTRFEKFFILHGMGQNGKTTVLNVLRNLLSERCCSEISLAQFSDPRMIYELYGKLANICGDAADIDRVQEDVLKKTISGDGVTADRKYKSHVKFRPSAKLFFATNELPAFNDSSEGIWRRMVIVPFDYRIPERARDPLYYERRLKPELPGIFIWAIRGLARLLETEQWTESAACIEALKEHRRRRFPILAFLEECCESTGSCNVKDLWECYRAWGRDSGLSKPKPVTPFFKDVQSFLKQLRWDVSIRKPTRSTVGQYVVDNLSIATDLHFWSPPSPPTYYC